MDLFRIKQLAGLKVKQKILKENIIKNPEKNIFGSEKECSEYLSSLGFNNINHMWSDGNNNAVIMPTKAYKIYFSKK